MRWEENGSRCKGSDLWLSGANTFSGSPFSLPFFHFFRCLAEHQRVASIFPLCNSRSFLNSPLLKFRPKAARSLLEGLLSRAGVCVR